MRIRLAAAALCLFPVAQAAAEWTLATATDAASYQPVTTLSAESDNTIGDEYDTQQVRPLLEFRCAADGTGIELRMDWRRFISSFNTEVAFAADDEDALTLKLGVDRSNAVTSTRSATDAALLLDYLAGRSSLDVTVTPYSAVPVTVTYDLAGFDEGFAGLRAACGG